MDNALILRSPDPQQDREAIVDLKGKTFGDYWEQRRVEQTGPVDQNFYDWRASRIGFLGETLVSHFGVNCYRMRVGCVTLAVAGVGAVATHGDFRGRGLMRRTTEAVMQALPAGGYHVSVLFGIPNFYHRFSYVSAWNERTERISVRDLPLPETAPPLAATEFEPTAFAEVYNQWNAGVGGTAVRPTFRGNRWPRHTKIYGWHSYDPNEEGYLIVKVDGDDLVVIDHAGSPEAVLAAASVRARAELCSYVVFRGLVPEAPLTEALRWKRSTTHIRRTPNEGAMARTVSLGAALREMQPELEARLNRSALASYHGKLRLADSRESVVLALNRGEVAVESSAEGGPGATEEGPGNSTSGVEHEIIGGDSLVHLLIGSAPASEVARHSGIRFRGEAENLAEALFPPIYPNLPPWDQF